jgi:hypothetical protein
MHPFHPGEFGDCLAYKLHENPPCQTWFATFGKNFGDLRSRSPLAILL